MWSLLYVSSDAAFSLKCMLSDYDNITVIGSANPLAMSDAIAVCRPTVSLYDRAEWYRALLLGYKGQSLLKRITSNLDVP